MKVQYGWVMVAIGGLTGDRSRAVSPVPAGIGAAPRSSSPLAAWRLASHAWRSAQLTIGLLVWALLMPAALCVRQAPGDAVRGAAAEHPPTRVSEALVSAPFIVLALTFFACCATHACPIFHTISYALVCGIPTVAAVSIYSLEGLAGLGGRVVLGILGDRYGAKRVLIAGLMVQALGAGSFVFVNRLEEFYAVA